ncbi:STAS domain-containing protein [candidate division KSB1 bacterium]|nr:STAS domain-containing protein [candidate division KSB1 bacterium]
MELKTETNNDILVVSPMEKRLDANVAIEFKENLINMIKEEKKYRILIDLKSVDFIDSSGLGAMISALKTIGKNGELKLVNPRSQVKDIFNLTRLNLVFNIFDNLDEALNSFN